MCVILNRLNNITGAQALKLAKRDNGSESIQTAKDIVTFDDANQEPVCYPRFINYANELRISSASFASTKFKLLIPLDSFLWGYLKYTQD